MKKLIAIMTLFSALAQAQIPVSLAPVAKQQFFSVVGVPLSGGKLCTYAAGTTTPQATYTDATGTSQATNPITMDSGGFASPHGIWLNNSQAYKFVMYDSTGTPGVCNGNVQWTVDGIRTGTGGDLSHPTVVDLVNDVPNSLGIAAADLAQLYVAGANICASFQTCILDGRGLTGSSYPWTTWQINRPVDALFPAALMQQTVDAYRPMVIVENLTIPGAITLEGLGESSSTTFQSSTKNTVIVVRNTNASSYPTTIEHMAITNTGNCANFPSGGIDIDGGLPNVQASLVYVRNVLFQTERFAIRENTSYFDDFSNIRAIGCGGFDLEGGNGIITNAYMTLYATDLASQAEYRGQPFIALEDYYVNQLVVSRERTVGHIFKVTTPGKSAAAEPSWSVGSGTTTTSGTVTFTEIGTLAYQWIPSIIPANSYVTTWDVLAGGGNNLWHNTAGICTTGVNQPFVGSAPFVLGSDTTDGTCTWHNVGPMANSASGAASGTWAVNEVDFEGAYAGNNATISAGNFIFNGLISCCFDLYGLNMWGSASVTLNEGSITDNGQSVTKQNVYMDYGPNNLMMSHINLVGGAMGTGLTQTFCNNGVTLLGNTWTTLTPIVTACPQQINRIDGLVGISTGSRLSTLPEAFSTLPSCSASTAGSMKAVNDSSTDTISATITGGGAFLVNGFCNGVHWIVQGGTGGGGGASWPLISPNPNPSPTGEIRLANADPLCWMNSSLSGGICTYFDGSNVFQVQGPIQTSGSAAPTLDLGTSSSTVGSLINSHSGDAAANAEPGSHCLYTSPADTLSSCINASSLGGLCITSPNPASSDCSNIITSDQAPNELGTPGGNAYTVLSADRGKLLTFTDAAAVALTVPTCASGAFLTGFRFKIHNFGAGTVTLTPVAGLIDGAASLALTTGQYRADVTCAASGNWLTD